MVTNVDLIILVIASDNEIYNNIINIYWKYLINYIEKNKIDIKVIFVYNKYPENINIQKNNILCFNSEESYIPGILKKTINAFIEIQKKYKYNYVLRTNISSFFIIDNLLKIKKKLKPINLYSGFLGDYGDFQFVSGAGIWLSSDIIDIIINNNNNLNYTLPDDIAIALLLKSYHKKNLERFDIIYSNQFENKDIENVFQNIIKSKHYHIRIKHDCDRINKDIYYFKLFTNILYRKSDLYFATFGGMTENFHKAVDRITSQAEKFKLFSHIFKFTEKDIINDSDFWSKHQKFIESNSRGYGYYIWKPYLIKKCLNNIKDGDILLYVDSGCELNINGINILKKFINMVKYKLILGTSSVSSDYNFTKMDLIKYFNYQNNIELLKKPHMQAGILLIYKCDKTINLINEWNDLCSNNYNFIDDSKSISKNFKEFIEHRHDQSVFNLLIKKYNLLNYDMDPTCFGIEITEKTAKEYLKNANDCPIWSCRNRSGKSLFDYI